MNVVHFSLDPDLLSFLYTSIVKMQNHYFILFGFLFDGVTVKKLLKKRTSEAKLRHDWLKFTLGGSLDDESVMTIL